MNKRRKIVAVIMSAFILVGTSMVTAWQASAIEETTPSREVNLDELNANASVDRVSTNDIILQQQEVNNIKDDEEEVKTDPANGRESVNLRTNLLHANDAPRLPANAAKTGNDLSDIVTKVEMVSNDVDRFGKPAIEFGSAATLKIKLSYDASKLGPRIENGDKLRIYLSATDSEKDLIRINYGTSTNTELIDDSKNPTVKIADIDMSGRRGITFTFNGEAENFEADINLPFEYDKGDMLKYFNRHPSETSVNIKYNLEIDGKAVPDKTVEYIINKPAAGDITQKFAKTKGQYEKVGKLGDGYFVYNLLFSTKLANKNEYVIYDIPDINQGFDGYLAIYNSQVRGALQDKIFYNYNTDPNGTFNNTKETQEGTKIKVYDVYYMTEAKGDNSEERYVEWEDKNLQFTRDDVTDGVIDSAEKCTAPKNILFEKLMGTPLTDEEQQIIDDKGGLYKTVGKGFKVTISDFNSKYFQKGGHITLLYHMTIKNPSNTLNSDGNPVYKNFATYYGQEIPTCEEGDINCPDIAVEKTKIKDSGAPDNPTQGIVGPGTIGANVAVPATDFIKVEADEKGAPIENKPLAGATFNIYKSDKDGTKKELAQNAEGITLENLITDESGKLTKDGKVVPLSLDKGYYIFSEISAPKGFEIIRKDIAIAVSYKSSRLTVANRRVFENPPTEQGKNVYVEYISESGEILEGKSIVKENAPIGEKYQTMQKTFEGYEFLKMGDSSAAREGTVSNKEQIVTYVYSKKMNTDSHDKPGDVPRVKEKTIKSAPQTGDYTAVGKYISTVLLILFLFVSMIMIRKNAIRR